MQSDIKNDSSFETKKQELALLFFWGSSKVLVAGNCFHKTLGNTIVVLVDARNRNDGV